VKPLSLYIDTSVIGGYFDPEFTIATRELWRQMEKGQYRFYVSSVSVGEVVRAPDEVRTLMANTFADPGSILPLTAEAASLAAHYHGGQGGAGSVCRGRRPRRGGRRP